MRGSIHDTIVGAYVETEHSIIKNTLGGAYAETQIIQLDVTLVGAYVEVQEEEMIYETVIVPEGVGALYQNVPLITITKR